MKKNSLFLITLIFLFIAPLTALGEVFYIDTDNVGSPVAMWDAKGKKVWDAEYLPFGEEFTTTKSPQDNKNRFIGKEKDKETGLTYFGARYFDERSGRFLTPDPVRVVDPFTSKINYEMLENPQRLNRYAYGLNNPYRYVDPDGEFAVVAAALAGADIAYFSAPDIANAPESFSTPTYESHGERSIVVGAATGSLSKIGLVKNTPKSGSQWSRAPKSIQDQMTLGAAKKGAGREIIKDLKDPKFKGMSKWRYKTKSSDGKESVVHYVKDPKTGKQMDYKFKKHSTD